MKKVRPPFVPCTPSPCSLVHFPEAPDPPGLTPAPALPGPRDPERRHLCLLQCLDNFDRQFTSEPPLLTPDDE